MKPGDGRATRAVFRNLDKETPYRYHAWESHLSHDTSLEEFTSSAKRYLGDQSELSTDTIENADWQKVYDYFKSQLEK
jgi:hypothetical protein